MTILGSRAACVWMICVCFRFLVFVHVSSGAVQFISGGGIFSIIVALMHVLLLTGIILDPYPAVFGIFREYGLLIAGFVVSFPDKGGWAGYVLWGILEIQGIWSSEYPTVLRVLTAGSTPRAGRVGHT